MVREGTVRNLGGSISRPSWLINGGRLDRWSTFSRFSTWHLVRPVSQDRKPLAKTEITKVKPGWWENSEERFGATEVSHDSIEKNYLSR